ncbi:MAG: hypothetical protein PUB96_00890 [Helicobacteraceae bacterium]|nr:hypothetical protein [Helicobacteraceae bacterium]
MKKILKICGISLNALLLSACVQKYDTLPNIRVLKTCETPIVAYEVGFIKQGDYDDLKIPQDKIKLAIENSLKESGCFIENKNANTHNNYRLDVVYGSIKTQDSTDGFWKKDSSKGLIFEVQYSFKNFNSTKIFYGKTRIHNNNRQYLNFIGKSATLDNNEIAITLQNAINSATNEAIKGFIKK